MLTELATRIVGRDTITLYQTDTPFSKNGDAAPHDGYRDRYVFDVKGPRIHGLGAVGAGVAWVKEGQSWKRELDKWQPDATPRIDVWVDARTLATDTPDVADPITLNGIPYRHGITWHGDRVNRYGINRADNWNQITDAASDRLTIIFGAVRAMFLALPDAERATILRALESERTTAEIAYQKLAERADELTGAILAL